MSRVFRRALLCAPLLLAAFAGAAHAVGQGRVIGTVVDANGAPLVGVNVVFTCPDMPTFRLVKTTDSHGEFNVILLDATRSFQLHLDKAGYAPLDQPLQPRIQDTLRMTFTLKTLPPASAAGSTEAAEAAAEPPPADAAEAKSRNDAVAAYNDGVAALKAKDLPGAIAKFESASTLDPKLPAAPAILAELYLQNHQPAEALRAADRALALTPGKTRLLMDRYQAYKALGDKPHASEALDVLANSHPAPDVAHDVAVYLYNDAADASKEQKLDVAIGYLKRAIEVDKTLEPAYQALAQLYMARQDNRAALDVADRFAAAMPESKPALELRYKVLTAMKDPRAAAAKTAMEGAKGSAASPMNQGIDLYNGNRIPEATKVFEGVVAADAGNARAHYMLGLCYISGGDLVHARAELETYLKLAPDGADAASARQMIKDL
jgi:Tfp pilus assembly protein PilF